MDRYIDSEKLKAEVECIRQDWLGDSTGLEVGEIGAAFETAESILDSIDDIIDSLQQEQTEILSTPEVENCVWSILKGKERYERGCKFCTAICKMRVEQKQMEVELERKVEDFCLEYDARKEIWYGLTPQDQGLLTKPTWVNFAMNIARHFYELGLNARKDE